MKNFEELIGKMTLEDKLLQMLQLLGDYYISEDYGIFMGLSYGFEVDETMAWNTGSILGIGGAANLKKAQQEYLKKSRHKIPLLFMHDVIHGYRTIYPSPLAMACSWQPELLREAAEVAAKEASVAGIHVTFSPMADLGRDARWGRNIEGFGEDPLLNSRYVSAMIKGYQGEDNDVSKKFRMCACVKHFAGYGMAEAGRDYNTTEVSEYALREYHFPAYKAAIDSGCKMVMTSFNALNGVPASGNTWLYNDVLRKEWGFDGLVISDCTAIIEMVAHGFAEDNDEAALKALKAGVDIEMVSTTYYRGVKKLIDQGLVRMEQIDEAVLKILKFKDWLGLFENPYKDADEELEKKYFLCDEHRQSARKVAQNAIVLLKNDGVLPLAHGRKNISIVGNYATNKDILDIWRAKGLPEECVSLAEGLNGKIEFSTCSSCDEKAVEAARQSDVIILAIGEPSNYSSEAGSRAYISLPGNQHEFADRIFDLGKPVIAVIFGGRPLALGNINQRANAILAAWLPGTEGGNAIADILLGECQPSARLTMSFPVTVGQCPVYYNAFPTGRPQEDPTDPERFRSRYLDEQNRPAYPFGHGLTYTTFSYSHVELAKETLEKGETLTASVLLKNTGHRTGTETVQLYIRDMAGSRVRPLKELKDFKRITLNPGEEVRVTFEINEHMLAYHTMDGSFRAEKGMFKAFIGENAFTENSVSFRLK